MKPKDSGRSLGEAKLAFPFLLENSDVSSHSERSFTFNARFSFFSFPTYISRLDCWLSSLLDLLPPILEDVLNLILSSNYLTLDCRATFLACSSSIIFSLAHSYVPEVFINGDYLVYLILRPDELVWLFAFSSYVSRLLIFF